MTGHLDDRLKGTSHSDLGLERCVPSGEMPGVLISQILAITQWSLGIKPGPSVQSVAGAVPTSVDGQLDTGRHQVGFNLTGL